MQTMKQEFTLVLQLADSPYNRKERIEYAPERAYSIYSSQRKEAS